jgi:hypothetical protein
MRDIMVTFPTSSDDTDWNLDIDIVNGQPVYVQTAQQTQDQRAAIAALISVGTIPGNLSFGVNWPSLLNQSQSLVSIDNEVKRQINALAAIGEDDAFTSYLPVYKQSKNGGVDVNVYRA